MKKKAQAVVPYPMPDEAHSLTDDYYSAAIARLELEWARGEVEGRERQRTRKVALRRQQ